MYVRRSELCHHGVKGMKWGVRRYQNEDGSLTQAGAARYREAQPGEEPTVLLKGSRLNSVSLYKDAERYKKRGRWLYTYDPRDSWDKAVYKGPFSLHLLLKSNNLAEFVSEHRYETIRDLKIPTQKQRIDTFIKTFNKMPIRYASAMRYMQDYLNEHKIDGRTDRKVRYDLRKLKPKDYKDAYEAFNHLMMESHKHAITRAYVKKISATYDGMIDDHDKGNYKQVNNPFIVFDPEHVLRKAGETTYSTRANIKKTADKVNAELSKREKKKKT